MGSLEGIVRLLDRDGQTAEGNILHVVGLSAYVVIVLLACDGQLSGFVALAQRRRLTSMAARSSSSSDGVAPVISGPAGNPSYLAIVARAETSVLYAIAFRTRCAGSLG